jgi:hypothetical protein
VGLCNRLSRDLPLRLFIAGCRSYIAFVKIGPSYRHARQEACTGVQMHDIEQGIRPPQGG